MLALCFLPGDLGRFLYKTWRIPLLCDAWLGCHTIKLLETQCVTAFSDVHISSHFPEVHRKGTSYSPLQLEFSFLPMLIPCCWIWLAMPASVFSVCASPKSLSFLLSNMTSGRKPSPVTYVWNMPNPYIAQGPLPKFVLRLYEVTNG